MDRISVYDDTAKAIEYIADNMNISTMELVDQLLENVDDNEIQELYKEWYERR